MTTNEAIVTNRFPAINTADVAAALEDNIPSNTRAAETTAIACLNEFMSSNQLTLPAKSPANQDFRPIEGILTRFILAARKKDGSDYKATTLKAICTALFRHLKREYKCDIWNDQQYKPVIEVLNSRMKTLQGNGLGETVSHKPFTAEQETQLIEHWNENTPMGLLSLVYYYIAKFLCARGGLSYCLDVTWLNCVEDDNGQPYFTYIINTEKNNQGGLGGYYGPRTAIIPVECNGSNHIRLIEKYLSLRPEGAPTALYLSAKATNWEGSNIWYQKMRMGKNKLNAIIRDATVALKFPPGNYSAHSIRATAVTNLMNQGVDRKLIKGATGHRTDQGLDSYIHHNDAQKMKVQTLLNPGNGAGSSKVRSVPLSQVVNSTQVISGTRHDNSSNKTCYIFNNCNVVIRNGDQSD